MRGGPWGVSPHQPLPPAPGEASRERCGAQSRQRRPTRAVETPTRGSGGAAHARGAMGGCPPISLFPLRQARDRESDAERPSSNEARTCDHIQIQGGCMYALWLGWEGRLAVADGRRGGEPLPRQVEPGLRTARVEPAGQKVTPIMLLVNPTRPVPPQQVHYSTTGQARMQFIIKF